MPRRTVLLLGRRPFDPDALGIKNADFWEKE